jgi:hypothetical protein
LKFKIKKKKRKTVVHSKDSSETLIDYTFCIGCTYRRDCIVPYSIGQQLVANCLPDVLYTTNHYSLELASALLGGILWITTTPHSHCGRGNKTSLLILTSLLKIAPEVFDVRH